MILTVHNEVKKGLLALSSIGNVIHWFSRYGEPNIKILKRGPMCAYYGNTCDDNTFDDNDWCIYITEIYVFGMYNQHSLMCDQPKFEYPQGCRFTRSSPDNSHYTHSHWPLWIGSRTHYAPPRAVWLCRWTSLWRITTEWAVSAKIQMSSFQFEIQLSVINAGATVAAPAVVVATLSKQCCQHSAAI